MNPTAIYSKSGKGVQEAAGKTSLLQRPDRAVLSAIDGRATLADVAQKVGKQFDAAFQALIAKLDKDGFVREVSAGAAAPPPAAPKPAAAAPKPAAKPASGGEDLDFSSFSAPPPPKPAAAAPKPAATPPKPAAKAAPAAADALDFSSLTAPPKPAAAAPQQSALNKAREEAEAKAQAERDRVKKEAEAKMRAEMEAQMRTEAEKKAKEEAEAKAKAGAEAQVKAAKEAALKAAEAKVRVEQDAKAKIEAERKAREDTERKSKEEADRVRKELEAERKAREDTERKSKEEAERVRKELEAERKAREEAERKAKEEAERARQELEEERKRIEAERKKEDEERAARRKREEEEAAARRKQKEEEERKAEEERAAKRKQREDEEGKAEEERAAKRKQREEEELAREREEEAKREAGKAAKKKQREEEEAAREAEEEAEREAARAAKRKQREEEEAARATAQAAAKTSAKAAPKPAAKKDDFADSLLADLDNFQNKDEEEAKAREEAERKAKAENERHAREEAERQAKEEAERKRRKDEEARRAREEEERRAQEDERRKREAEEIRKKAEAATAAAMAKEGKKAPPKTAADDIPVDDDDLDMDEVKKEAAAIAKGKPKEKPEKEKKKKRVEAEEPLPKVRRPGKPGKPIALGLGVLLVIAVGVVHVMPLGTADYERVVTEALGRPVKIGSANLWLLTGVQVRFSNVTVGEAKIAHVTGHTAPGSVFGEKKEFSKIELDGLSLPQQAIGDAMFATLKSERFSVDEIVVKSLEIPGPATLPKSLQADASLDATGRLKSATVRGPDGLVAKIAVQDDGVSFEATAAGFTLPIVPQMTLSNFSMKGTATPRGMSVAQWGGSIFGGAMSGTANVRWGGNWNVDGVLTVRSLNAAVFAPTLLSSGTAEGTGKFSMSAADPSGLPATGRLDGNFTVSNGTLGSFDLAGAIQSGGKNYRGSTQFVELTGQGSYDRGAIALRNINIGAGALNAGATADISQSGALSGRIVADVKTTQRALSATLLLGGTVKEPQVRN
ncbi:MAG TPA: hypothetical protein VE085_03590 [Burkholderiales bacterium]|nr:hypothetical protein [Burkholderiales bacterium]